MDTEEAQMSKGYIVIAQNNDTVDYLEQAYALALNLKLTQGTISSLAVCVDAKTKALHLGDIGKKSTEKNSVKCVWGDAFESIKSVQDDTYDHIFVDLNDDQFCIDLAAKNMDSMIRILKPKGVITAQVGSQDKKPKQVDSWLNVFNHHFGNTKISRVYIPSFDCSWNFSSSINH